MVSNDAKEDAQLSARCQNHGHKFDKKVHVKEYGNHNQTQETAHDGCVQLKMEREKK